MKKLLFFTLVLFIAACGSESAGGGDSDASGSSGPASTASVTITTASGEAVGSVSGGHSLRVGQGAEVVSRMKDDKRKYDLGGGQTLKVTYKEDGFKLKKESGELIWKIKIKDEKIKISDNEENENPYEIRFYDGDRAKLKYQEQELGDVRLKDGKVEVEGPAGTFLVATDKFSASYGSLLIDRIPLEQRLIIIAELLALGK
jgi:hypothetical protein